MPRSAIASLNKAGDQIDHEARIRAVADVVAEKKTDCVVEAIRFGWIDGQKLPLDEKSYLQRLTPRKPKSNWSAKNREHANRLIAEGRMAPTGLANVEGAKADGRWESAYAGLATMIMPQDFLDALEAMPAAKAFSQTLDRKNLYPIYYRLHTAKRPGPVPRDWPRSWRNWIAASAFIDTRFRSRRRRRASEQS